MLRCSTNLLLLALVASAVPAIAKSTFGPQSLATFNLPSSLPENEPVLGINSRGGDMSVQDKAISGAAAFLLMDTVVRKAFRANKIAIPPQLGGCIILFATMLLTETILPGMGDRIFKALAPGAALLTKWLPVFFVPGLAMLPLAPSIGNAVDHIIVLSVVVLGFYFSCGTVAFSVLALRKATGKVSTDAPQKIEPPVRRAKKGKVDQPPVPLTKPFLDSTFHMLAKASFLSGVVCILATRKGYGHASTVQTIFHFLSTVTAYVWASLLPPAFTKFVHPLVICTTLTWGLMQFTAVTTGSTFKNVLAAYKVGSLHWSNCGAGDHLLNLLGPSVIAFAIAMYSRKNLLKENLAVVIVSMIISAGGGLFGTAAFVRAINLGGKQGALVRLSVLSRNVTTALAIAVTSILGGDISIAASVVVLTGIFAATFGRSILTSMGIHDPVARGLGIGGSGQGLGVASMSPEPDAFPFAAMSMVLTAVFATTLVSIPAVKDTLVTLATGV